MYGNSIGESTNWRLWSEFFERKSERPEPETIVDDVWLQSIPDSVARSLASFQIGEARCSSTADYVAVSGIAEADDQYAEAIGRVATEKHRHASLLSKCVQALGVVPTSTGKSLQTLLESRRLIGFRSKVLLLLVSSVLSICYYRLLSTRIPAGQIRDILDEIVEDGNSQMLFHCSFFYTQTRSRWRRALFLYSWRLIMTVSAAALLIRHRTALRDLRLTYGNVWNRWASYSRRVERLVLRGDVQNVYSMSLMNPVKDCQSGAMG